MATTMATRLEIVSEFADGQTYQFSLTNPKTYQASPEEEGDNDYLDPQDIEELSTWMLANQPLKMGNTTDDTLSPFAKISSATIVTTQKNLFYESDPGNWERDQKANAWKDNYN